MKTLQALILVVLSVCQAAEIHEEILNGFTARPGQFPYQALLDIETLKAGRGTCGGSLISRSYVLTAAHCLQNIISVTVSLGVTDVGNTNGVVKYTVPSSQTYIHPDFNSTTFDNDVAIISLPKPVRLTRLIKTVALPRQAWAGPETYMNDILVVSGFGQTYTNEATPTRILQFTLTTPESPDECNDFFSPFTNVLRVKSGMICVKSADDRNTRSCPGDSGGPLTLKIESGLYQVGIVSWGRSDCETAGPSVYTDVAYFLPWINNVTGIPIS